MQKDPHTAKWAALPPQQLVSNEEFKNFLITELNGYLKKSFAGQEIPKKYIKTDEDFTLGNGMLTQTLKVVRGEVMKKYGDALQRMYSNT